MIDRHRLRTALADVALVKRIYAFDEIGSTSSWAKDLVLRAKGSKDLHGTFIISDFQSAGRGRHQRTWQSEPGSSLLFTLVVDVEQLRVYRAGFRMGELSHLVPLAICNAVDDALARDRTRIKFPNDILLQERKVAGILLERVAAGGREFCCVGVGINVNQEIDSFPSELRDTATSLRREAGGTVDRYEVLRSFCEGFEAWIGKEPTTALREASNRSATLGQWVEVNTGSELRVGEAIRFDAGGGLVLRLPSGMETTIYSGDVSNLRTTNPIGERA